MSFKPAPKAQVTCKFHELFGYDCTPDVRGERAATGLFVADLYVNDVHLASTQHRDWRLAYKLLKREVEKLYADGLSLV